MYNTSKKYQNEITSILSERNVFLLSPNLQSFSKVAWKQNSFNLKALKNV